MQFKLQANITNTSGAVFELSQEQLQSLTDGVTTSGTISLSSGQTIILTADLLNRYDVDKISYYYSGSGALSIEVAESQDLWYTLTSNSFSGGAQAYPEIYDPRWVRITQEVDSSVDLYELEIYNQDGNILFGFSGNFSSYGLDASGTTVQKVDIYNPTSSSRNINLFIDDSESTDADELLLIGLSDSGPFYGKFERGLDFPTDYDWDNGYHIGTETTVSGHLTLSGVETSGTYYSPVFSISGYEDPRFFWEYNRPDSPFIDFPESTDSESCFGVRRFNIAPSGTWVDGYLAEGTDYYWAVPSGVLVFRPVPNLSILELRAWDYMQFCVTISGTPKPYIYKAGIETPLTVSGVQPNSYKSVYLTSSSGTTSGKQANLICWYRE